MNQGKSTHKEHTLGRSGDSPGRTSIAVGVSLLPLALLSARLPLAFVHVARCVRVGAVPFGDEVVIALTFVSPGVDVALQHQAADFQWWRLPQMGAARADATRLPSLHRAVLAHRHSWWSAGGRR